MKIATRLENIFKHFMKSARYHAGLQIATIVVLVSCFTVIAGLLVAAKNLDRILTLWGESIEVSVYINENATPLQTAKIEDFLMRNEKVDNVKIVTREKALATFREQMASYAPDLLSDPDLMKLIPQSIQFAINSNVALDDHLPAIKDISQSLKEMIGVDEVNYGQEWVKNYAGAVKAVKSGGVIFGMVILLAVVFVVSNAIRSSISQRRQEIEVLELIGATSAFIRRPFLYEGGALAGTASLLAVGLTYAFFETAQNYFKAQLSLLQISSHIQFLSIDMIALLIIASVVLGVASSYFCLRSMNDGWAAGRRANQQ